MMNDQLSVDEDKIERLKKCAATFTSSFRSATSLSPYLRNFVQSLNFLKVDETEFLALGSLQFWTKGLLSNSENIFRHRGRFSLH